MLIYKITNTVNNKIYIGQTTLTLKERMQSYYKEYRWGKRDRPIALAMRKYGFENFNFEIIKDGIKTKKELDRLERKYIRLFKSFCVENGYNVELGGNGQGKHSKETKRKISEAQKGEKNHMYGKMGELNKTSKKVIELTTGEVFESASIAAKKLNLNFSHVCAVARGTRGSTGGYVFRYVKETGEVEQPLLKANIKFSKIKDSILPKYKHLIQ